MTHVANSIVERLAALRQRVRLFLGMYATGLLVGLIAAAALVLSVADYLVHFSGLTRVVALVLVLAGLAVVVLKRVLAPLSTKLTDQFLASRVETLDAQLADELMSAVHFVRQGTAQSNALAAKAVEAAEARARGVRFEDALNIRQPAQVLSVGLALGLIVLVLALVFPQFRNTALARWASPFGGAEWPRRTHVEFVWNTPDGKAPSVLPQGESLEVRAQVNGPQARWRRVYLYTSVDGDSQSFQLMTLQQGQSETHRAMFMRSVELAGQRELRVRLVADDDTEQGWTRIPLARRPEIRELSATILPPAYVKATDDTTSRPAPLVFDLLQQAGRAVEESTIKLRIKSTNPLAAGAGRVPEIRFIDQNKEIALPVAASAQIDPRDPTVAEVTLSARQSMHARVQVCDTNGFTNRTGGTMVLDVVPDAVPTVVITEPRQSIRAVPDAVIKIGVSATDDLGIDAGKWRAENYDAKTGAPPRFDVPLAWTSRAADRAVGTVTVVSEFPWPLAPLQLKEGERLTLYAMVQDNYEVNGKRHDWVKSAPLTLTIISAEQAQEEARTDLMEVRDRIVSLNQQTERTAALTRGIQQTIEKSKAATSEQARALGDLAQQQAQQSSTGKSIEQKIQQIQERLQQNKMVASDLGKVAEFAKTAMRDVAQRNMAQAAQDLGKAQEAAGKASESQQQASQASKASEAAANAGQQQQQAMNTMQDVIKRLDEHNSVGAAREAINKLIEKVGNAQGEIQKAAGDPSMMGKNPSELSPENKEKLEKIGKSLEETRDKTVATTEMMKKMAEKMANDPAAQQSLENAAKAGEQSQTAQNQGAAASAAKSNKTDSANNSAGQAMAGLQQMKDELDKLSKRQLEQLAQALADLIARLKQHVVVQKQIREETDKAGKAAAKLVLHPLGDRQGTLHLGTIESQKRAEAARDAREAAGLISSAVDQMRDAATALFGVKQPAALGPQAEAVKFLEQAIKKLEEQKKKIDDELRDKDLAYFIGEYDKIKKEQEEIKAVSDNLPTRQEDFLQRHYRTMAEKGAQQDKLISRINELSNDKRLKEYEAVIYINQQIIGYMTEAKNRLAKAQTGRQLAWNQQKAIDRITDLIEALKEEKAKKDEFDKPDSGGGSGGGGGGKKPLIPPAQQLKLLKSLQVVVNRDTIEKSHELTAAKAQGEKNAVGEDVKKLGDQQVKIQDIAKKVIEKMKAGG